MEYRIEIAYLDKWRDAKGEATTKQINDILGLSVKNVKCREVYTILADIEEKQVKKVAEELNNPVIQQAGIGSTIDGDYDWLLIVGYRPELQIMLGKLHLSLLEILLAENWKKAEKKYSVLLSI